MVCPNESDLIRWVADELAPDEAASVQAHIDACPACRGRADALQETWAVMDLWRVDSTGHDVTADVLSRIEGERIAATSASYWAPWRWSIPARAAACFILAATLGWGAGQLWPSPSAPQLVDSSQTDAPVSTEDVANALGLEALNGGTPVGMAASLLEPETESTDEPTPLEDQE